MRKPIPLVALALVAALTAGAGILAEPGQAASNRSRQERYSPTRRSFNETRAWSEYVTMRDGVRLAVDVHVPKGLAPGERTATILHMSRYYRSVDIRGVWRPLVGFGIYSITERDIRKEIVKAGYSWVDVDVRGTGASFGHREYPLSDEEVRDGSDLLDWIVAQPWSAGMVGATGASYDGALASLLLRDHHPALEAIVPRFSGWDAYDDIFVPGGVPATPLLRAWARLVSAFDHGHLSAVLGWSAGIFSSGVRSVDPDLLPQAMAEHEKNVDPFELLGGVVYRDDPDPRGRAVTMDDFSPHTFAGEVADVPIFAYAGWFDGALQRGQVRQYLANRNPGSRLRIGPWFHAGEFNASPDANGRNNHFDHARELIRFFDYHLRGMDDGFSDDAPVHYYTMGEERWRASEVWPPPGAVWRSFYLSADRRLGEAAATTGEARDRYAVDPTVTSGPGSRWGLIVGTGHKREYGDRRQIDQRLLTYTTEPLREDLEVTGHPIVRLFVSANATDGAVFAYLEDVRPDGEVRYITEGELRLIDRKLGVSPLRRDPVSFHSFLRADARPMAPGRAAEVVFDLLPTSMLFRAGHSIRLAIAGADAGSFDAPLLASPLVYEVYRDIAHSSRLEVPTYPPQRVQ